MVDPVSLVRMASSEPSERRILGTVVCLPSRDLEASLEFYRGVFDLPDLQVEEDIVTVELPNLSLFLMGASQFESYTLKAGRTVQHPDPGTGVILSCAVETREGLDSMIASVPLHGGTVPVDATEDLDLGLYIGYFFDPDGHHWELAVPDSGE